MNAEQLMELYDRVSDAPDAIPRLRRFILNLGVRGKLAGACEDWKTSTLGELGAWGSGGTPLKSHPEYYGGDIPWLVIGDLNDGLVTSAHTYITQMGLQNSSARIVQPGTVLIAMYGSIGKLGVTGIRCATNQAIAFCVPDSSLVTNEYLFLLLKSLRETLLQKGQGVAQQNISQKILKAHKVRLPSTEDQARIVAKVDELMALCDRLEAEREKREATRDRLNTASLSRLTAPDVDEKKFKAHARFAINVLPELTTRPDQIKVLRQTILDLAVRGKLVEQDPKDETGYELLKRLSARRDELGKEHRRRRTSLPNEINDDERYLSLPASWTWARLFQLGETQTGTSPSSSNPLYFGHFVPFVKPGNLDGVRITYDGMGLSETGMSRSRVARKGSVLMVCIGATLGKVNVAEETVCFNQQINSVTPFLDGLHAFVALALKASSFQRLAWSRAGTGTLPIISKGKWEILPVPLPPLAEQQRIVTKVKDLMNTCEQVETNLAVCEQTQGHLLNALLVETLGPGTLDAA